MDRLHVKLFLSNNEQKVTNNEQKVTNNEQKIIADNYQNILQLLITYKADLKEELVNCNLFKNYIVWYKNPESRFQSKLDEYLFCHFL